MKPYAYTGTGHTVHSHNECYICSGQPRSNKTTRQHSKKEIQEEVDTIYDYTYNPPCDCGCQDEEY